MVSGVYQSVNQLRPIAHFIAGLIRPSSKSPSLRLVNHSVEPLLHRQPINQQTKTHSTFHSFVLKLLFAGVPSREPGGGSHQDGRQDCLPLQDHCPDVQGLKPNVCLSDLF